MNSESLSLSLSEDLPSDAESLYEAMDALARYRPELGEQPGDMIGNYRLIKRVGAGGMGEVWRAEQQGAVRQKVALKIVKLGMDTRAVVGRFEIERKTLAVMEHPHIAKIFDGGATATGRPYFSMEYVNGVPITTYARQTNLDLKGRLELLVQACQAVQHAHQKGIVHRDLKPSNILVEPVDGKAHLKIIDFGIAKALNGSPAAHTMVTGVGQILGTLGYMSPEQTILDANLSDTRSDIYGLGAILYELLTGALPFDIDALTRKGRDEALRVIRSDTPKQPSARLVRNWVSRRPFRKEFDWVVMKALEKDPLRRYQSAAAFSEDLTRLLEDRPVQARPENLPYILRKWFVRNRLAVAAVAAIMVAILTTTAIFSVQHGAALERSDEKGWLAQLERASTQDVSELIAGRRELSPSLVGDLHASVLAHPLDSRAGLHSRIAVLSREETVGFATSLAASLWQILDDDKEGDDVRFRAAAALAGFAPRDLRWQAEAMGADVAEWLAAQVPVNPWIQHFRPIAAWLRPSLEDDLFHRPPSTISDNAAILLAAFFPGDLETLLRLVGDASPGQMPALVNALKTHGGEAVNRLESILGADFRKASSEEERDRQARSQSRAGMALMQLEQIDKVVPHLIDPAGDGDPRLRTFLTHGFAAYHIPSSTITGFLDRESSAPWLIRAGLLALGDYVLTQRRRESLRPTVTHLFEHHPDPGVHSCAEWLLRHWHRQYEAPDDEDAEPNLPYMPLQREPEPGQLWYVNPSGMTMAVIEGPVRFTMGVPDDEPDRKRNPAYRFKEIPHQREIPRTYAIATMELTFRDYERFRPGFLEHVRDPGNLLSSESNTFYLSAAKVVDGVGFEDALRYCNWLSEQEGIPAEQHCFIIPPDDKEDIIFKEDFLSLQGYRLATEAEWEYACRSGSSTARFYGRSEELLLKYGWYEKNAADHAWAPGILRPNGFGLFDVLGNRTEWVHGYHVPYPLPSSENGIVVDDEVAVSLVPLPNAKSPHRSVRGGSSHAKADALCSGARSYRNHTPSGITLRLVRTLQTFPPTSN